MPIIWQPSLVRSLKNYGIRCAMLPGSITAAIGRDRNVQNSSTRPPIQIPSPDSALLARISIKASTQAELLARLKKQNWLKTSRVEEAMGVDRKIFVLDDPSRGGISIDEVDKLGIYEVRPQPLRYMRAQNLQYNCGNRARVAGLLNHTCTMYITDRSNDIYLHACASCASKNGTHHLPAGQIRICTYVHLHLQVVLCEY
jgi:hypothetical protein